MNTFVSMEKKLNITTFEEILDRKYGKCGALNREQWEQEFEAFKNRVLIEETSHKRDMTLHEFMTLINRIKRT